MNDYLSTIEGHGTAVAEHALDNSPAPKWAALVDDRAIPMPERHAKVAVIKAQAEIPPGFGLARDFDSPDDVVLGDDETVDLAAGNVFYRLAACDAKPPHDKPHGLPKLAFFVDDRAEMTINPNQTGKALRELFGFNDDVSLFRDFESPHDEPIGLEQPIAFEGGPVFYTRRRHVQLKIIVNNKPFTEAEGVKHHMTGLQIAALVSDTPANTEVFHLLKHGTPVPVPLDKEIHIEECEEFRVIRNNVAGGFELARIDRELELLRQGRARVDFFEQPFSGAIYRDIPTRPGYAHLQMTDVLVIVPGGYPGQPLDGAYLPEGSPLLGRVAGQPQPTFVSADGRRWQLVSYHPHNGGGASPWNKDKHGLHTYYDEILCWVHRANG